MPFNKKRNTFIDRFQLDNLRMKKNKCKNCGSMDKEELTLHHIDNSPLLEFDEDNIIVLCKHCHDEVHKYDNLEWKNRMAKLKLLKGGNKKND